MMSARSRHIPAFTLIELLVVISIVGLLIAILLPALAVARESARGAQCLSNQRQVAIAMAAYQAENADSYVPYNFDSRGGYDAGIAGTWWTNRFWNLGLFTPAVLVCPSFEGATTFENANPNSKSSLATAHYGYNYLHLGSSLRESGDNVFKYGTPARSYDVLKPSETLLMMDTIDLLRLGTSLLSGYAVVNDRPHPSRQNPYARHQRESTINITWADGHVSSMKMKETFDGYNPDELTVYLTPHLDNNRWDRY